MMYVRICLLGLSVVLAGCATLGEKPAAQAKPEVRIERFEDLIEREHRSAQEALDEAQRFLWEQRQRKKERETGCRALKEMSRTMGSCWI